MGSLDKLPACSDHRPYRTCTRRGAGGAWSWCAPTWPPPRRRRRCPSRCRCLRSCHLRSCARDDIFPRSECPVHLLHKFVNMSFEGYAVEFLGRWWGILIQWNTLSRWPYYRNVESNKNVNLMNYGKNLKIVDFNFLFSKNHLKSPVQFHQPLERKLSHYWAIWVLRSCWRFHQIRP